MLNHLFVDLWFKMYDTGSTKIDHTKNAGCLYDMSIANEVEQDSPSQDDNHRSWARYIWLAN